MDIKLKEYIEKLVLPEYEKNDSGHGIEHINYVIKRCNKFAQQFINIDLNMLYTIACFHDVAHHINKDDHEILSAQIFYENDDMKQFFSDYERIIIKEAIEDHRASSCYTPRSDYGKIISSADRSTDVNEFLKRTHSYTLKHQPDLAIEEMIERAYRHTYEKYGNQGYAKHYVSDEEYEVFRLQINLLIDNREMFEEKYKKVNNIK